MHLIHASVLPFTPCLPTGEPCYLQAGTGGRGYPVHGQVLPFYIHCCCVRHMLTVPIGRGGGRRFFWHRWVNVKIFSFCEIEAESSRNAL